MNHEMKEKEILRVRDRKRERERKGDEREKMFIQSKGEDEK